MGNALSAKLSNRIASIVCVEKILERDLNKLLNEMNCRNGRDRHYSKNLQNCF